MRKRVDFVAFLSLPLSFLPLSDGCWFFSHVFVHAFILSAWFHRSKRSTHHDERNIALPATSSLTDRPTDRQRERRWSRSSDMHITSFNRAVSLSVLSFAQANNTHRHIHENPEFFFCCVCFLSFIRSFVSFFSCAFVSFPHHQLLLLVLLLKTSIKAYDMVTSNTSSTWKSSRDKSSLLSRLGSDICFYRSCVRSLLLLLAITWATWVRTSIFCTWLALHVREVRKKERESLLRAILIEIHVTLSHEIIFKEGKQCWENCSVLLFLFVLSDGGSDGIYVCI